MCNLCLTYEFTSLSICNVFFFFSSRRRHTRFDCDWSSDVCSSDLFAVNPDYTGPTSGSLHQGLNKLGPDVNAAVIMLGDMVRVTAETLPMLIAAARGDAVPLVVSRQGGGAPPPLLLRRTLVRAARA